MTQEPNSGPPIDWTLPVEQPASEPRLERLDLRVMGDLLVASGDPRAIADIHNRQSFSNDLRQVTRNILAGLFLIMGALIIVFGPQNKFSTVIMGVTLLVIAAGTSGFTTFSFKGFGITVTLGQTQPNAPTRIWHRAVLWLLLGAAIGGGVIYASLCP